MTNHKGKPEVVFVAISNPDGSLAIMQFVTLLKRNEEDLGIEIEPTPENIEAEIIKSGIQFISWRIINPSEIPQDRTFRNAWIDGAGKIEHDMDTARDIHMARIRIARNAKLVETDKSVAALDGSSLPAELKAFRQKLRDIPQTLDLTKASTIEELKALWPAELK